MRFWLRLGRTDEPRFHGRKRLREMKSCGRALGTHPLLPQLLLQWCQAAFLPQHAAVPPAESRKPNEARKRAEVSKRRIRDAAVEEKAGLKLSAGKRDQ